MPSAKILEQKKATCQALSDKIQNAAAGVIVSYTGITVEQDTALRKELREAGVDYKVYKNSIIGRACEAGGYGDLGKVLEGMNAIAISENDPIAPAKILKAYADKIKTFEIKAGFIDGGVIDTAAVNELASTPSKEEMVCRVMGSMMGPLYGLAYVLQAKIDKEEESAD